MRAHERIEWVIAYGLALVSALTASLYGFMSAAGPYGIVKGAGLFFVAFIGCHGPAWIVKAKRQIGWPGAIFGTIATSICLGATLWGGLGTTATGGAMLSAERVKANTSIADDRAMLAKLETQRKAVPAFVPTTAEAFKASEDAAAAAERTRKAECGHGDPRQRGKNCRERELDEAAARSALVTAAANKGATDSAAKLDSQAAGIRERLAKAPPTMDADPQASAFSRLTGIAVDMSAALYAFWLSLAFELGAMFCMMIAYSNGAKRPALPVTGADATRDGNVVSLDSARPQGDPARFALARLAAAAGQSIELGELHAAYREWCSKEGLRAMGGEQFAQQFSKLCTFADVETRATDGRLFCIGLALTA